MAAVRQSSEAATIFSTHDTAQYCRHHICPSLTSFLRFFDSAEGVYSTSSASGLGSYRHIIERSLDGATRVERLHRGRPGYASLAKGMDGQFPSRLATEQVISVAPSMLRQHIDSNGRVNR
jgi:hypothetical protein